MAKLVVFVAALTLVVFASKIEGRSLPAVLIEDKEPEDQPLQTRVRRDDQSRKPGPLRPSVDSRDEDEVNRQVSNSIADGILCNVAGAMPGTKVPCSEGNYLVEWLPVENGAAANINVYSVLDKVNRF